MINYFTLDMWNDVYVQSFIAVSSYLSFILLGLSLLFLVKNIVENFEKVDIKIVFLSLVKGFAFATTSQYVAQLSYVLAIDIVKNFNSQLNGFDFVASNFSAALERIFVGGFSSIVTILVITIGIVSFLVMTLVNTANVLISTFSAFLYVPYIVNGDTAKGMEWITQIISLSITYVIRYICFYIGICLLLNGTLAGYLFVCAIFVVPKALQKFGYSSGTGNSLSRTANTVSLTARSLGGFLK